MSRSKDYEVVNCKDLDGFDVALPDFLFYDRKEELVSKSFSAAAAFSPCSAVSGTAWKSSTAPSKGNSEKKKILIFDSNSFAKPIDIAKEAAFIMRLRNIGFEIRIAKGSGEDKKFITRLINLIEPDLKKSERLLLEEGAIANKKAFVVNNFNKAKIASCMNDAAIEEGGSFFYHLIAVFSKERLKEMCGNDLTEYSYYKKIIEQNFDIIFCKLLDDISEYVIGRLILEATFAKRLLLERPDKITKYNLSIILNTLGKTGINFDDILKSHRDKITKYNLESILESIANVDEAYAKRLLVESKNLISNDEFLRYTIQIDSRDAEEALAGHEGRISLETLEKAITRRPDLAEKWLDELYKLRDGKPFTEGDFYFLSSAIEASPDLIDKIWDGCKDGDDWLKEEILKKIDEVKNGSAAIDGTRCNEIKNKIISGNALDLIAENVRESPELIKKELEYADYMSFQKTNFAPGYLTTGGQTFVEIISANKESLEFLKQHRESFSSAFVLKVGEVEDVSILPEFLSNLPNVKIVVLPERLKGVVVEQGDKYYYQYDNPVKNTGIKKGDRDIFIGDEKSGNFGNADNSLGSCKMYKAGEILSKKSSAPLKVRDEINDGDILNNLDISAYQPKSLSAVADCRILTEGEIESLKEDAYNRDIYRFNISLKKGKKYRLPSVLASEQLIGIMTDNGSEIKIERGDDDFFYATAKEDCRLSYVVAVDANEAKLSASYQSVIPRDNPIRKLIDDYKDFSKGFKQVSDKRPIPEYDESRHAEWMEEMFEERLGVCRNRAAVVEYFLRKNKDVNQEDVRMVGINGNHVALEVRYEGRWYYVDLGGGEVDLDFSDEEYKGGQVEEQDGSSADKRKKVLRGADIGDYLGDEFVNPSSFMKQEFSKMKNLEKVSSKEELMDKVVASDRSKVLVVAGDNIEGQANAILKEARKQSRRAVFYLDSPDKIDFDKLAVRINKDSLTPLMSRVGMFEDFLKICASNEVERKIDADAEVGRPLLLINWSAFSEQQIAALNTVLDRDGERKIHNHAIPDDVQIIGLCKERPEDYSFLSRHNLCVMANSVKITKDVSLGGAKRFAPQIIDLQGFPDYRESLFGRIILVGDHMEWQKSDFFKSLEEGNCDFVIKNISAKDAEILRREIATAKALGYFIYEGYKIAAPEELNIEIAKENFEFSTIDTGRHCVTKDQTVDKITDDFVLINSHIFDILLHGKSVDDNKRYREEVGLIEGCATKDDKKLTLFISSDLSESQWYCLFCQAKKFGVELDLRLAPEVLLPPKISLKSSVADEVVFLKKDSDLEVVEIDGEDEHRIFAAAAGDDRPVQFYVSNNTSKTAASIMQERGEFAVIDVEDFSYQDLVESVSFEIANDNFKNFEVAKGRLISGLGAGEKIILKGEFSEDLLQMLHPLMIDPSFRDKLVLIFEEKDLPKQGETYDRLKWLPKDSYKVCSEEVLQKQESQMTFYEKYDSTELDENSKEKSDAFIRERRRQLAEMMARTNLIRLIGHSGVGKSNLIKSIASEYPEDIALYNEMSSLDGWARDKSDKVKVLFIDESNIEDMHFTMFSNMKKGCSGKICYKGKSYELDENHKVIFACNPKEYGGGRVDQKLFDDGSVPHMYLQDFPACYIYEKILKESIYNKLSDDVKAKVSLSNFKDFCKIKIKEYQAANLSNGQDASSVTVRELQEDVLGFVLQKFNESENGVNYSPIRVQNFVSTRATSDQECELRNAINIRKKQKIGDFPSDAVGLNGILINGAAGCGKSEMIRATLESINVDLVDHDFDVSSLPREQTVCYKIDAALPLNKKREIIIKAFNEGNLVWIDELNTCIDDGLEKVLNAVMTGANPDTGEKSPNAGFMLISSVNQASYAGRSELSPAIIHRMRQVKAKDLKEYSVADLAVIVDHWIGSMESEGKEGIFKDRKQSCKVAVQIAKDFKKLTTKPESSFYNLRSLQQVMKKDLLVAYRDCISKEESSIEGKKSILESGLVKWSKAGLRGLFSCFGAGKGRVAVLEKAMTALEDVANCEDWSEIRDKMPEDCAKQFHQSSVLSKRCADRSRVLDFVMANKSAPKDDVVRGLSRHSIKRRDSNYPASPLLGSQNRQEVSVF